MTTFEIVGAVYMGLFAPLFAWLLTSHLNRIEGGVYELGRRLDTWVAHFDQRFDEGFGRMNERLDSQIGQVRSEIGDRIDNQIGQVRAEIGGLTQAILGIRTDQT